MAHRYAWELKVDAIPDGMEVRRKCGDGLCVNPSHMYLITLAEKFKIMQNCHPGSTGVGQPLVLNKKQVKQVMGWRARGWTENRIAKKFGVSRTVIHKVVTGKSPYQVQ